MAKRGRPPVLQNQIVIDNIIGNIEKGYFVETSAALAGISRSAFYNWLKLAKEARRKVEKKKEGELTSLEKQMMEFAERVQKAQANAEKMLLEKIDKSRDWKAVAWRLEHLLPEKYTERKIFEGSFEGEIKETQKLDEKQLKTLGDLLVSYYTGGPATQQ